MSSSIEIIQARSGDSVVLLNGRHTASRVDPRKEGESFAAEIPSHTSGIVVLGAGSGYHLRALLDRKCFSSIHVIEAEIDLLKQVSEQDWDAYGQKFVWSTTEDFWNPDGSPSELCAETLLRTASIHRFGPSYLLAAQTYRRLEEVLIARTPSAFSWAMGLRAEGQWNEDPSKAEWPPGESIASIKTITRLLPSPRAEARPRRLWLCLEELVR